jgi:hypothetical protein
LAPDALTPSLDPAAAPGERPLVLAPTHKMVHEERQEAAYAAAVEKSKRTGKPMEIDSRGRPVLPRWPLVTGVLPFMISRGVPIAWAALSAGLAGSLWVLLMGIQMSSSGMGALTGMPLYAIGCILTIVCAAGTYSVLLQIVIDSSAGCGEVQQWPSFIDWFGSLMYLGVAAPLSVLPGWALGLIPAIGADVRLAALLNVGSVVLFLPIIMLSQADINSPAGIVSARVLTSMARCFLSWLLFYLEVALLGVMCGGATYFVAANAPGSIMWLIPMYVAVLLVFARLLGRLAWRLAEAMAIEAP